MSDMTSALPPARVQPKQDAQPTPQAPLLWSDVQAPKYNPSRTAWLLSLVDLTSLMVVFFVLIFSQTTLKSDAWNEVAESFKAKFASPDDLKISTGNESVNAASVRDVQTRSSLGYLDVLMQQHLERIPQWSMLRGVEQTGPRGREMMYVIPAGKDDVNAVADWQALGGALRGWKNPVGVRVSGAVAQLQDAAMKAQALSNILSETGVDGAFAEIVAGEPSVALIVRAR